jgi:hypothetical protein
MGLKEEAERLYRLVMAGEDEVIAELAREELAEPRQGAAHGGKGR